MEFVMLLEYKTVGGKLYKTPEKTHLHYLHESRGS
mgnify:CR=1 FL=1